MLNFTPSAVRISYNLCRCLSLAFVFFSQRSNINNSGTELINDSFRQMIRVICWNLNVFCISLLLLLLLQSIIGIFEKNLRIGR